MRQREQFQAGGYKAQVYTCNTAIVGTGAAGYNAADRLWSLGQKDILIVTEDRMNGTSRNAGSDKQTYYKLTLSGSEPDSVRDMAQTLFEGQCVDGDLALCEAALSAQCFFRLVELGVPFPRNLYGEYVGYKTDHDPRHRATSAGPYTGIWMTECLERAVLKKGIQILDKAQVIKVLSTGSRVCGLLCLNLTEGDLDNRFILVQCKNIIYATGGPAGIYADSVYPPGQYGATGLALEAGARGKNLTEWQYGMASLSPRWNVSGTYMQVLPRFYSTDEKGGNQREFLMDYFHDVPGMLSNVFLKGYQWPFDIRKVQSGSSVIDVLVYLERRKGRRVYLDFRNNPAEGKFRYEELIPEAQEYLRRAGACFGTPIERLEQMNRPAVEFYRDRGVDLACEPLEIALCAQHNNGGLAVDCWWQTNVEGLFAVGEAAATHGVYRPGGTALNAGQVGSTRAAEYIALYGKDEAPEDFASLAAEALREMGELSCCCVHGKKSVREQWQIAAENMSRYAAAVRDCDGMRRWHEQVRQLLENFSIEVAVEKDEDLPLLYRFRDVLISQYAYLSAMLDYASHDKCGRGSAMYISGDEINLKFMDGKIDLAQERKIGIQSQIQELQYMNKTCMLTWRKPRPIPNEDDFFENVWRSFRERYSKEGRCLLDTSF